MTPALRAADARDLAAIVALERTTFPTDAWSEGQLRAELADRNTAYLVLTDGDAVIGYGGVLAPRGSGEADIQTVAVSEAARGRGSGRMLVTALLDAAGGRGASRVFLEVRADNPVARSLYTSLGFEEIGTRPHYYQPDDVAAIVMRLELPARAEAPR